MSKNEFLPFGTAEGANVLSAEEYQYLQSRLQGFMSGVARSAELNTVWRQSSVMAAAIAQLIVDNDNEDVLDDGDFHTLKNRIESVIEKISTGVMPLIAQETGSAEDVIMSQKAVTEAISDSQVNVPDATTEIKGKVKLTHEKGESESLAMSQKGASKVYDCLGVIAKRYSSVAEMLTDTTTIIGSEYSTGGTRWRKKIDSSNSIFDFEPLTLIDIEDFGARENQDSSEAIREAVKVGAVRIQAKAYIYDKQKILTDNVTIIGDKKPVFNDAKTQLIDGSIIVGELNIKGKNPTVINLGIDNGISRFPDSTGDGNGLVFSRSKSLGNSQALIRNAIGLCRLPNSPYHAILCEGHSHADIKSVVGIKSFYGLAVKSSQMNIDDVTSIDNNISSVIIKSDSIGDAASVNISNINAKNCARALLRILATDSTRLEMLNVSNFNGDGGTKGIELSTGGTNQLSISSCNISNINIKNVDIGLDVDGENLGIGDLKITNTTLAGCRQSVGKIKGFVKSLKIDGFYGSINSATGNIEESLVIEKDVRGVIIDNFELVQDMTWNKLAGLVLNNNYASNTLGIVKANLKGIGIPRPGFSEDFVGGADIKVIPNFDSSHWSSMVRFAVQDDASISTIERLMASGSRFPHGYRLTIVNDSLFKITIKHNLAGFISNKNSRDAIIPNRRSVNYIFTGDLWHEV